MKILGKSVTIGKHLVKEGDLPRRKGFNIECTVGLANQVRILALALECPNYAIAEHLLELGLNELVMILSDDDLKEKLKVHLLKEHVLVAGVNENDIPFSFSAMRINAALKLIDEPLFIEKKKPTPQYLDALVHRITIAMKVLQLTEQKGVSRERIVKMLEELEQQEHKPENPSGSADATKNMPKDDLKPSDIHSETDTDCLN